MDIESYKNRVNVVEVGKAKRINVSNIFNENIAENNIRGFRATKIFIREEEIFEYKMLYKHSYKFRKYIHMSKHSKSKRVRNKYLNKIDKDIKWVNDLLNNI